MKIMTFARSNCHASEAFTSVQISRRLSLLLVEVGLIALMKRLLVTTGTGMFGQALIRQLLNHQEVQLRVMVRDSTRFTLTGSNIELVIADMDQPETLQAPTQGVTHVFLTSPMDERITARETAVIDACKANGNPHVINIYGAVKHEGDHLDQMHGVAIEHLKQSGLPWTMVSPSSVMETSFLPLAQMIPEGEVHWMSGDGKVGFVALDDVARVLTAVVHGQGHAGKNYECTGPYAESMPEVVEHLAAVLGKPIRYCDHDEQDFATMLLKEGLFPDRESMEIGLLCHLRAWREGRASLVTDTVEQITGIPAMTVMEWLRANRNLFLV